MSKFKFAYLPSNWRNIFTKIFVKSNMSKFSFAYLPSNWRDSFTKIFVKSDLKLIFALKKQRSVQNQQNKRLKKFITLSLDYTFDDAPIFKSGR